MILISSNVMSCKAGFFGYRCSGSKSCVHQAELTSAPVIGCYLRFSERRPIEHSPDPALNDRTNDEAAVHLLLITAMACPYAPCVDSHRAGQRPPRQPVAAEKACPRKVSQAPAFQAHADVGSGPGVEDQNA